MTVLIKIHKAYRMTTAICDSELLGKKFEQEINGNQMQIDLTGNFFKGNPTQKKQAKEIIEDLKREDATFFIVGEESCKIAIESNLFSADAIIRIQNIPIALSLI